MPARTYRIPPGPEIPDYVNAFIKKSLTYVENWISKERGGATEAFIISDEFIEFTSGFIHFRVLAEVNAAEETFDVTIDTRFNDISDKSVTVSHHTPIYFSKS